ncbi:hypothetical protein EVAR_49565_1 [Eumeta japonica]|uniref:Uncharacterized protein n=1 Tax=Eumeta variegata TaxID=151549 RepID=A0A4C1YQ39_EUMVA|nr:hypothetical protein EVAR_49565_1 [Eumeta japonica]
MWTAGPSPPTLQIKYVLERALQAWWEVLSATSRCRKWSPRHTRPKFAGRGVARPDQLPLSWRTCQCGAPLVNVGTRCSWCGTFVGGRESGGRWCS